MMSVVVYPRLGTLLRQKQLTVAELERQIKLRFGLAVNPKSLYRLTQAAPVQRADLEIAGATAAVLGVGLDDLFTVEAVSKDDETEVDIVGPAESERMSALIERQKCQMLTDDEWDELESLVASYGRQLHERRMQTFAQQRGVPVEQIQRETAAQLAEAHTWWDAFEADPDRERMLAKEAAALRAAWPK